ncbi:MAG TPA: response regulator [Pseudolabrys sp.]|nr:response regulator [Pseudolabrys sp.]
MSGTSVISIVDDDESVLTAMRDMVESFGFTVGAFASAEEFLSSKRLHDTACLILDVEMPGMSGPDLYARLTASGHRIPTMFVTAFHDARIHDRVMKAGAVCCLAKPFDRNEFLNCIRSALRGRKSGEQPL